MMLLATVGNEYSKLWDLWWSNDQYRLPPASFPYLIVGSLVGTGIGYTGWWCRSVVSATSYTLIGGASDTKVEPTEGTARCSISHLQSCPCGLL